MRSARREGFAAWFGLAWFLQHVRAPPPARARRCDSSAARRWSDGASWVDGEGHVACGIEMGAGSLGRGAVRGKRRLWFITAPAGDALREEGGMTAWSGAFGFEGPSIGGSRRASFCCVCNVSVGLDVLGLLGAMFICRRGPHKIRLLLVYRHYSGALRCFGHAFVSFRARTCPFRTLLAQACMLMLFHVVQTWRVVSGMAELGIAQALCALGC
jgi:hypothetical protein